MAITVSVPKEITEYEEKIVFGLSKRKLICLTAAVILAAAVWGVGKFVFGLSDDITSNAVILAVMPPMACGFIKKDGMKFEEYFLLIVRHKFGRHKLYYAAESSFDEIWDTIKREKEQENGTAKRNTKNDKTLTREQRKSESKRREAEIFERTKKSQKANRKAALKEIKRASKEYRQEKRRAEKEAKEKSCTQDNGRILGI